MNTPHDELERMLGRDLHDQVDGMVEVPFGLNEVKGRAGRIRRNRRIAAGVGVAAALAVIVPTAITAGGIPKGTERIDPAPSPDVPVEVSRTTLTLEGLSRGEAPAVEYFTFDGVVLPGEGTRSMPANYQALVRSEAQDGWIALGPAADEVLYLSEALEPQSSSASGNRLATTPERDYVAWTTREPDLQTIAVRSTTDPEDVMSWEFPERPAVEPVGILGPDSVVFETTNLQGRTTVGLAYPDGTTQELPYIRGLSADPVNGVLAVQTEVRGTSGCFGVVEAATRALAWETCDDKLGSFSPDGNFVMATAAESDGNGLTVLHVLDARTGDLVAEYSSRGRTPTILIRPVWEPSGTIVAMATDGERQTLVRLSVDGTLEEVADPVPPNAYDDFPYYFGADRAVL